MSFKSLIAGQTRRIPDPQPPALKVRKGKEEFLEGDWYASLLVDRALGHTVCFREACDGLLQP